MDSEVQVWILVSITTVLVVLTVAIAIKERMTHRRLLKTIERSKRIDTGIRCKLREIESILDQD